MERPSLFAIFSLILALPELLLLLAALGSKDVALWVVLFLWGIVSSILGGIALARASRLQLGAGKAALAALLLGVAGCIAGVLGVMGQALGRVQPH
jgi:hypothetical protein